jgi:hypothetical protein
MRKGIGPNNLGSPAKMGHGMKSMAKMYDSPAKKSDRLGDKEKAAKAAEKRAQGMDAESMRRKKLNVEVKKELKGKPIFGAAGAAAEKEAIKKAKSKL